MPRFEPLAEPLKRQEPVHPPERQGSSRAGAGRVRLPFVYDAPLAGWGPFLRFGARTALKEDTARLLHARALVLEAPGGDRVALVTIDLHGGSRYVTEQAAAQLAGLGFHPGNLYLCGTHNHAGPAGLYASPYFDAFAASTGIFATPSMRVGFNKTLADELALRVVKAVTKAVENLAPARIGSSHQVKLPNWSRQRSAPAMRRNFPEQSDREILHSFKELCGEEGLGLERGAVDARVQTIAAFHDAEGPPRLIGSFSTWGAHCAVLSREREVQSADYFGEAASLTEARHPDAVVAVAAGSIGDSDPLPPGLLHGELLELRADEQKNFALIEQQARGLSTGLLEAIDEASRHQAKLTTLSSRFLEDEIAGAKVDGVVLPELPRIGVPTIAGSELGTGDIRILCLNIHLREGVRKRPPDPHDTEWPRTQTNRDDRQARFVPRTVGQFGAWISFRTTRPYLAQQPRQLPLRYLELQLEDRTLGVLGLPGEPTSWLAHKLAALAPGRTLVTGVTGDYVGYLTTEAEYRAQHYEGSSTIWGRYTERWLTAQVKKLASGEGTARSLAAPHFQVLAEQWTTRISGESGAMTEK